MFALAFWIVIAVIAIFMLTIIFEATHAGWNYEFDNDGIDGSSAWLRDRK
jgi:membrane protein YdbS with pleckstrin-like domain